MTGERLICVAQVIGEFGGGGAERQAFNLALGLESLGARSVAVAVRKAGVYAEESEDEIDVVELGAKRGSIPSQVRAVVRLRKAIREKQIDALHVQGSHSLPLVVLATRGMRRKPKILFTWQDSESVLTERGRARRLMVWALRRTDAAFGSSRSVVDRLESGAGLSGLDTFHGGVPVQDAVEKDWSKPPLIFWLGRFLRPKDPQALIRAAAVLRDEGHRFTVFIAGGGGGPYRKEADALIRDLGLEETVRAPGYVEEEELAAVMREAQIGVQTSHTEGMSMALLEQMMAGLAVVATDVGDTHVALQKGECGLLVEPRDSEGLVRALRSLITDPARRKKLGDRARERAKETYSLQAMCRRALSEYQTILG